MSKICPRCNTANPAEANFCRHCRYQFRRLDGVGRMFRTRRYCAPEVASTLGRIMLGLLNCNIKHR